MGNPSVVEADIFVLAVFVGHFRASEDSQYYAADCMVACLVVHHHINDNVPQALSLLAVMAYLLQVGIYFFFSIRRMEEI